MAMKRAAAILGQNRVLAAALALSLAAHAAIFTGIPVRLAAIEQDAPAAYSATLEPAPTLAALAPLPQMVPVPGPKLRRVARRAPPLPIAETPMPLAEAGLAAWSSIEVPPELPPVEAPQLLAMAGPAALLDEPARFPVAALPANISISYQITSAVADGSAVYSWEREGDNYRISGEAQAEGFFTLFLEGQIHQESRGTVSDLGLRPETFVETRPNNVREGLEFDWRARQVKLFRGDSSKMSALTENTVDWLSMIFQLAHTPPGGGTTSLQVFTQRKMYRFRLEVLGEERIEIPLGSVRALHLRHTDPKDSREVVDVWLGLEQHNLPVKLRFPVARNRLMVEQVATQVSTK
jgi:hypothetical protein